ncbi:fatty acyl-CoA reductase 2, chloroplastic-like [Nicotiana tomentosiformis]|uniref:fatty acyl-CoA reductase 2, chloroplastic-like n=1 Tax=Nicotiana tomentosiformis TaxID=4098 RepID=UPI00388C67EA
MAMVVTDDWLLKLEVTYGGNEERIREENGRVLEPLIFFYGKGHLPCVLADPDCIVDVVPIDMVVNATMAAIAKHGYLPNPELNVYHLASMPMNPLSYSQLFDYSYEFFHSFPFINTKGNKVEVKRMKYFDKISAFSNFICEELFRQYGLQDLTEEEIIKFKRIFKRKVESLKQFSKLYEPYLFYKGWFHNGNMQKLMEEMSEEEKKSFEIDVGQINWGDYFLKIHIPGVQENVLKGKRVPGC